MLLSRRNCVDLGQIWFVVSLKLAPLDMTLATYLPASAAKLFDCQNL